MSDKPHRAWLQFHLTTAILLMFLLALLMHLNLRPSRRSQDSNRLDFGWPLAVVEMIPQRDLKKLDEVWDGLWDAMSKSYGSENPKRPPIPPDPVNDEKLIAIYCLRFVAKISSDAARPARHDRQTPPPCQRASVRFQMLLATTFRWWLDGLIDSISQLQPAYLICKGL